MFQKKHLSIYPINIELLGEGGYFAECLALQGCFAGGETLGKEVLENIEDMIRQHMLARLERGDAVPSVIIPKTESVVWQLALPVEAAI